MTAFLPIPIYILSALWMPFFYVALIIQGGYIVSRGISLGRLPLIGLHDTLIFLSFSTALFSLPFYRILKKRKGLIISAGLLASIFTLAGFFSKKIDTPLPPVLKTLWFELHVVLSFFSYGLFGIGAILGVLYMFPTNRDMEPLQYRAVMLGYLIFSISMIFGGIWAFLAWGTYWLWTPKELWTVMLWLVPTLYLHLRYRPWWKKGKAIVFMGIFVYLIVLFTYLGVGLLMKSSHSF